MPPAVCLIGVTYVGCNTDLAVALLTLGTMFVGGMYSGFLSNHIDIAPPFAGTLMGITNTFATIPGIIVPSFVGYMTHGNVSVGREGEDAEGEGEVGRKVGDFEWQWKGKGW